MIPPIRLISAAAVLLAGIPLTDAAAQRPGGGPPMRMHTATERGTVTLVPANRRAGRAEVKISTDGGYRYITANGIPSHDVGRFPNRGNPNALRGQNHRFRVTLVPSAAYRITSAGPNYWGVAVNGVPFEPGTAEFWRGDRRSGWNYDALGGAVGLGLDANNAHVQPTGAYHYHALPTGLMQELGWREDRHSPLIGWAADGFPVYALTGNAGDGVQRMTSSYRLKRGERPGGSEPDGRYDGTFVQDYVFVAGRGDLDACNGAVTRSPEFPSGRYAYFITDTFPFIGRCWTGTPDQSFMKRRASGGGRHRHGPGGHRHGGPGPR